MSMYSGGKRQKYQHVSRTVPRNSNLLHGLSIHPDIHTAHSGLLSHIKCSSSINFMRKKAFVPYAVWLSLNSWPGGVTCIHWKARNPYRRRTVLGKLVRSGRRRSGHRTSCAGGNRSHPTRRKATLKHGHPTMKALYLYLRSQFFRFLFLFLPIYIYELLWLACSWLPYISFLKQTLSDHHILCVRPLLFQILNSFNVMMLPKSKPFR